MKTLASIVLLVLLLVAATPTPTEDLCLYPINGVLNPELGTADFELYPFPCVKPPSKVLHRTYHNVDASRGMVFQSDSANFYAGPLLAPKAAAPEVKPSDD